MRNLDRLKIIRHLESGGKNTKNFKNIDDPWEKYFSEFRENFERDNFFILESEFRFIRNFLRFELIRKNLEAIKKILIKKYI